MPLDIKVPAVGESISEVTVSRWLKKDGDFVEMDEVICELESDKATFELNAEAAGTLKTNANEGDTIAVGSIICSIDTEVKAPEKKKEEEPVKSDKPVKKTDPVKEEEGYAKGHPSPAAQKILNEKGVKAEVISGTGKDGRITKEDAINADKGKSGSREQNINSNQGYVVYPTERNQRREKMSNLRKTVSKRLVAAKNETAMLTTFNEVDMKPIMDLRSKFKDKFKEKHQVNLGFMSFFTRAVSLALREFPSVNAMIDGEEMIFNEYVDISIAVSAPKGLVVPVIRNADSLSLAEIEKEVMNLAGKARDNKLTIEEMTGGTFTITNGGVFGSMLSTPIINPPQSAILGMHNIVERAVVKDGQIVIRPIMFIALSYDHRIIDGKESVGFLVKVKNLLENPVIMLSGKDATNSLLGL